MIKFILIVSVVCASMSAHASFEERSRRYLSGHELLMTIQSLLPAYQSYENTECHSLVELNRNFLGDSQALTGEPISVGPNQNFVQWLNQCVSKSLEHMGLLDIVDGFMFNEKTDNLIGPEGIAYLQSKKNNPTSSVLAIPGVFVDRLVVEDPLFIEKLVEHQVKFFLGSDETIRDFGLIQDPKAYRAELVKNILSKKDLNFKQAIIRLTVQMMLRDEFLSY